MSDTLPGVELRFTLGPDDWIEAWTAYHDHVRFRTRLNPYQSAFTLFAVAGLAVLVFLPGSRPLGVVYLGIAAFILRPKRWRYRRAARRLMAANPSWDAPVTVVISAEGIATRLPTSETRSGWDAWRNYAETARAFVLLSSDRPRCMVQVTPKRGLAGTPDEERLRALFDQHLVRLRPRLPWRRPARKA